MTLDAVLALQYADCPDNLADTLTLKTFDVNLYNTDPKKIPK